MSPSPSHEPSWHNQLRPIEKHLKSSVDQQALQSWLAIFDDTKVRYVGRTEWLVAVKQGKLLEHEESSKEPTTSLIIPEDGLHNYELPFITNALLLERYFSDNRMKDEQLGRLREQGIQILNVGIYLAKRLTAIEEGRALAEQMARQFFTFGSALLTGMMPDTTVISTIANLPLNKNATIDCDTMFTSSRFFAEQLHKAVVQSRKPNVDYEVALETLRQNKLAQYFRLLSVSIDDSLSSPSNGQELTRHRLALTAQSNLAMIDHLPIDNVYDAIYRRGMHKLVHNMKVNQHTPVALVKRALFALGFNIVPDAKIYDECDLDQKKSTLETMRKSNNKPEIVEEEVRLAKLVSKITSQFAARYNNHGFLPSANLKEQIFQCAGFSNYASALLTELRIPHLLISYNNHSKIIFRTSDDKLFWLEPQQKNAVTQAETKDFVTSNGQRDKETWTQIHSILDSDKSIPIYGYLPTSLLRSWGDYRDNFARKFPTTFTMTNPKIGIPDSIVKLIQDGLTNSQDAIPPFYLKITNKLTSYIASLHGRLALAQMHPFTESSLGDILAIPSRQ